MLQLATAGEPACHYALRSPSVESFFLDSSAADMTSTSNLSSMRCYDLKRDEFLVCERSRESVQACHQLCGALASVAHFDAYAAGYSKSISDFVVDEEEKSCWSDGPCNGLCDKLLRTRRQAPAAAPTDGITTHHHDLNLLSLT